MDDQESESKFDRLVNLTDILMPDNKLTRIPSIKSLSKLKSLWLGYNKITMIRPGDFAGADRLVMLTLDGNNIMSVAAEAFGNLGTFKVKPDAFRPTNSDGTLYVHPVAECCVER